MDRSLPVWVVTALLLALLMLLPLGWLVALSLSGDAGAGLSSYRVALTDPHLRKALWNTLVLAFWVGIFSLAVGAPMAWLTARTDLPGKRAVRALMLASFAGSLIGLGVIVTRRGDMKYALPFGTFLAIGAAAAVVAGPSLLDWYLGLWW